MDHHKQTVADKLGTSVIQIEAMVEAAEFLVLVINEFPPYKIFIDPLLVGQEGLGFVRCIIMHQDVVDGMDAFGFLIGLKIEHLLCNGIYSLGNHFVAWVQGCLEFGGFFLELGQLVPVRMARIRSHHSCRTQQQGQRFNRFFHICTCFVVP